MIDPELQHPMVSFGAIADLQYCDQETEIGRYFRKVPDKLYHALHIFNEKELDFVINLGDTIDRHWESYEKILPVFHECRPPLYHVLGNHDYEVADQYKAMVHERIGTRRYYDFSLKGWHFIVLDGNEISTFANVKNSDNYIKAEKLLLKLESQHVINGNFWNGAIGKQQLEWLESLLSDLDQKHQKTIIFCHFPIYPAHRHNLLNDKVLLDLISKYPCVKMWINGHNHDGNYGMYHHRHFVNLKGIVDTEFETAFSIFELFENHIRIIGFGNEISAKLTI